MDFAGLPPEINSSRMYMGPGAAPMLAASAGWDALAAELHTAASGYHSVIAQLTDQSWMGPSSLSMAAAATPYLIWMRATAAQCEEAARQATGAAAAYETAYAMTVPPPMVVANRVQLATLVATNLLGQNTSAIMANEARTPRCGPRTLRQCTATRRVLLRRQLLRRSHRHRRRPTPAGSAPRRGRSRTRRAPGPAQGPRRRRRN